MMLVKFINRNLFGPFNNVRLLQRLLIRCDNKNGLIEEGGECKEDTSVRQLLRRQTKYYKWAGFLRTLR